MTHDAATDLREQVIRAARDVERLSAAGLPPDRFFPEFLRLSSAALGAEAAALWLPRAARPQSFDLRAEWNIAQTELRSDLRARHQNQQLIAELLSTGQARLIAPMEAPSSFPSRHHVVIAPLHDGTRPCGVVQFLLPHNVDAESHAGYLQMAEQLCGWGSNAIQPRRAPAASSGQSDRLAEFADFVLRLQRTTTLSECAATVAAEGRTILSCDRVSVAERRGARTSIEAVSGHHAVNARGNLLRRMTALAELCIASGEAMTFAGTAESLPPSVVRPMAEFLEESGARVVCLVPLVPPAPAADSEERNSSKVRQTRQPAFGCLIIERFGDAELSDETRERIDLISDHVAAALWQSLENDRIFLRPLWLAIGRSREHLRGRRGWKAAAAMSAAALIGIVLAFVPWTYRVEAEGRLMPAEKRRVFAPQNGDVAKLLVQSGQSVSAGEPLLILRNDELRTQLLRIASERHEKEQLAESLRNRIDAAVRQPDRSHDVELQAQRAELLAEIAGLQQQEESLDRRISALTVRAPIDGVVATFQIEELLQHRPIRRGEALLEVMRDAGPWQLELDVQEHRLGHLLRGQSALATNALPVDYVLASAPEEKLQASLATVAGQAVSSTDKGNVVEVVATIDAARMPRHPRIGAEVRARIRCGQRSLGYVLFGDVIEFVRKWCWL